VNRSGLSTPKSWRDVLVGLGIVTIAGALPFAAWHFYVEYRESECRKQCAASGDGYRYLGPSRRESESCYCIKSR